MGKAPTPAERAAALPTATAAAPIPAAPNRLSADVLMPSAHAVLTQASAPRVDMWLWTVMALGLFGIATWMVVYSTF
jgi:hypothetical protein